MKTLLILLVLSNILSGQESVPEVLSSEVGMNHMVKDILPF